jgi:hypothetical protein
MFLQTTAINLVSVTTFFDFVCMLLKWNTPEKIFSPPPAQEIGYPATGRSTVVYSQLR